MDVSGQVEIGGAVPIPVEERGAGQCPRSLEARLARRLDEGAVPAVPVEDENIVAGDEQILVAVAVGIGDGASGPPSAPGNTRRASPVGEAEAPIVSVELVASRLFACASALDEVKVQIAITIVIKETEAGSVRLEDGPLSRVTAMLDERDAG
ncbi:MAG: hypothetical protein O7H41_20690 [Planctomycetota bacterium]|nr:hypothetical protein [Planctomycetota bacterium]